MASGSISAIIKYSQIKNNLTTTAAGGVLDARQGKALNDKINAATATGSGTITYTSNSVVDSTNVNRCSISKLGTLAIFKSNMLTNAVKTADFVKIATVSPGGYFLATLPLQGSTSNATIQLDGTNLRIYKGDTSSGWIRMNIPY